MWFRARFVNRHIAIKYQPTTPSLMAKIMAWAKAVAVTFFSGRLGFCAVFWAAAAARTPLAILIGIATVAAINLRCDGQAMA